MYTRSSNETSTSTLQDESYSDDLKIGEEKWEGAYGIVSTLKDHPNIVVKCNIIDEDINGFGSFREFDIISQINHPCIVKLEALFLGDIFPSSSLPPLQLPRTKYDKYYMGMERAPIDNDIMLFNLTMHPRRLKEGFMQILLGLEFLHSRGYIHQDIKINNLLYFPDHGNPLLSKGSVEDQGWIKICDFGLTVKYTGQDQQCSENVGHWQYRSPEIFLSQKYDYKVDIWCAACCFYELLFGPKSPLLRNRECYAFDNIIRVVSPMSSIDEVMSFLSRPGESTALRERILKRLTRSKVKDLLRDISPLSVACPDIEIFNSSFGTYDQFIDLLKHMLELCPEKRYSATQALDHDFFKEMRPMIDQIRSHYKVGIVPPEIVMIEDTDERRLVTDIYKEILEEESNPFINPHIIFFALDLYDRYLEDKKKQLLRKELVLKDPHQLEFIGISCLYVAYKYLEMGYRLKSLEFFINAMSSKIQKKIVTVSVMERINLQTLFEVYIAKRPTESGDETKVIYRDLIIQAIDYYHNYRKLSKEEILDIFNYYININNTTRNIYQIYKDYLTKKKLLTS